MIIVAMIATMTDINDAATAESIDDAVSSASTVKVLYCSCYHTPSLPESYVFEMSTEVTNMP